MEARHLNIKLYLYDEHQAILSILPPLDSTELNRHLNIKLYLYDEVQSISMNENSRALSFMEMLNEQTNY